MREDVLVLNNDETKRCTRCGKDLNILRFYRKGDRLQSWCIDCQREYRRLRESERTINEAGFSGIELKDILRETAKLTPKQRTDLRNALKHIASRIR